MADQSAIAILKKPQLSLGKFTSFVTSDTVIVVAGAILVTPILLGILSTTILGGLPVIRDNVFLALGLASLILFILAILLRGVFGNKLSMLFFGASAGALINAIQQTSFAQNILNRIGGR